MKLASVFAIFLLAFALAIPAHAVGTENVALEVGASDLYATVPLCTYWYALTKEQGITPQMAVTNYSLTPITIVGAILPSSEAVIAGIPCEVMQTKSAHFMLTENPHGLNVQKRAVKQAVIFTISKIGG